MLKVICIDENAYPTGMEYTEDHIIKEGCIYEVIDIFKDEGYIFYELSIDVGFGYWERCFAICSEIDEIELLKEREAVC